VPLVSGSLLSHYEIRSQIGSGGMGEVYLAHDTKLGRSVALKILPEELAQVPHRMQRFIQEARAASAINHPNVCIIHEVGQGDDGRSFIAMEYIEGETLASKIERGPLPSSEIIDLGIQIASGLEEAHSKGIIHRDIKPRNIAVTPRGQAKVLDFGLAHVTPPQSHRPIEEASTLARTDTGILLGTIDYMSPEQALGREIDTRTDIFSLGVVFYEMATGRKPFSTENKLETIDRIAHAEPEPVSRLNTKISSELQHIISKCLEKNPQRRYQTAQALLRDLAELQQEVSPRLYRRHRRLIIAFAVLSALLAVLWIPTVQHSILRWFDPVQLPSQKCLTILPLRVVGDSPVDPAVAEGLLQTMTSKLSRLEQFQGAATIIPASEVIQGKVTSLDDARRLFGATLVVNGSLQRYADKFRLTLNLVDAQTRKQLDSRVIDEPMTNILAWQDGVAIELMNMLQVKVQPEMRSLLRAGHTQAPGALEFYLQGRSYLLRYEKPENIDIAIRLFDQAALEDPIYADAFAALGEAYWRKYQATKNLAWIELATRNSRRAIELDNQLPAVHVTLGLIAQGSGRYTEALQEFQQVLKIDEASSDAYRGLANAHAALGQLKEAEETYLKAIETKPAYWSSYHSLAMFYYSQRRYEEAIRPLSQVVALTPDNIKGYNDRGAMYVALERWEEALKDFTRSLQIQPNYPAYSNLGVLHFYKGDFAESARFYERAIEIIDTNYRVWGNLASAYYWTPGGEFRVKAQSNYQRAARMAEEELRLNPREPTVLTNLAQYYGMLGKRDRALFMIRRALALAPNDNKTMFRAAEIHEHLDERSLALHYVAKALASGYSRKGLERSLELRELRTDPRFQSNVQTSK